MIIQSLNNEKFNKNTVYLFLLFIVFQACKSIAILPTNSPIKNVNIEALASKIRSNYPKVNNVRSRIKATYNNGKRKQQIIVQFRMESKKKLWLSAHDYSYSKTFSHT